MSESMDSDKLKLLQKVLLATLLEVDRICRENDIRYFLAGGTLLGAIRHHGFIPWDDDVDVMMLREDYEKFLRVAPEELSDRLFLQRANYNPYTRVRVNGTVFASPFMARFPEIHSGIFLDIFAHDRTGSRLWSQKLHRLVTKATRSVVFNKWGATAIRGDGSHPVIRWIGSRLKDLIPMNLAIRMRDQTLVFFRNRDTGYLYDGMGQNMGRGAFPEQWLNEAISVDFEGYSLSVPKEYDAYLTWLYGDYMQLPPEGQRHPGHDTVKLDFGIYEKIIREEVRADHIFEEISKALQMSAAARPAGSRCDTVSTRSMGGGSSHAQA
ncbi:MAG: LicD family protein [Lachnospiraceae bacterium]|nr:LicD family protein [Lachnospiraceae bacterium]